MVKSKVIFEDEEQVEIKYPCFELKDIVEYYFEICTPNNSITPFSLVALPNANILVSIYISDSSQTFKVHREHGIIDTSGDKISGSLTEAITVIHAPGTHEFSIKFKPGVLYSCLSKDISTLVDNHLSLQKYALQLGKEDFTDMIKDGLIHSTDDSYSHAFGGDDPLVHSVSFGSYRIGVHYLLVYLRRAWSFHSTYYCRRDDASQRRGQIHKRDLCGATTIQTYDS